MTQHADRRADQSLPSHTDAVGEPPDSSVGSGRQRPARVVLDWAVVVAVALIVAFVVRSFLLAHFVVEGSSMSSTLSGGDRVFVNKLSYRIGEPNRGDVVVLHQFSGSVERDLIKRVIALPGEEIEVRSCEVYIDGRLLTEPYLDQNLVTPGNCGGDTPPTVIADDHVFVMGDNRSGSQDSRSLGAIPQSELVGRAFVVFWPSDSWRWL